MLPELEVTELPLEDVLLGRFMEPPRRVPIDRLPEERFMDDRLLLLGRLGRDERDLFMLLSFPGPLP